LAEDLLLRLINERNTIASAAKIACHDGGGNFNSEAGDLTREALCVVIVTVATTGVTPSVGVIDAGDTAQVDMEGAPLQLRATAWLKPPAGVTVSLSVPVAP
jgi:hypothetical protein